nr:putative replication associated protein [Crucivirus sp.]
MPSRQCRGWIFTWWCDKNDEPPHFDPEVVRWACYQEETCPTSGRRHLQGTVWFAKKATKKTCLSRIGTKSGATRVEVCFDPSGSRDYCLSLGKYSEKPGVIPDSQIEVGDFNNVGQGKRSDLTETAENIRDGMTLTDVAIKSPQMIVKYGRGLQHLRLLTAKQRDRNIPVIVHVLYGSAGKNKTRAAYDMSKDEKRLYSKPSGGTWWDGYDGGDEILIDEFDPEEWKRSEFLKVTDRYPHMVQTKGGFVNLAATTIIITTNHHPRTWFVAKGAPQDMAILRRIDHLYDLNAKKITHPKQEFEDAKKKIFAKDGDNCEDISDFLSLPMEIQDQDEIFKELGI